jgi:hypothetical protein
MDLPRIKENSFSGGCFTRINVCGNPDVPLELERNGPLWRIGG